MNDDQLQDLKQFFSVQLSQTEQRLTERIDGVENSLTKRMGGVEERLDNIEAKVDTVIETMGVQPVDHEARLTNLESAQA